MSHPSHFINNQWIASSGPVIISRNSAKDEIVWEGTSATLLEVNQAVTAARAAHPAWSRLAIEKRI